MYAAMRKLCAFERARIKDEETVPMVILLAKDRITLEAYLKRNGAESGEHVIYNIDKRIVQ